MYSTLRLSACQYHKLQFFADYRQDCKSVGLGEPPGVFVWSEHQKLPRNVSLRRLEVGRVRVEQTYEYLIRVSDATGLPYAPCSQPFYYQYRQLSTPNFRFFKVFAI